MDTRHAYIDPRATSAWADVARAAASLRTLPAGAPSGEALGRRPRGSRSR